MATSIRKNRGLLSGSGALKMACLCFSMYLISISDGWSQPSIETQVASYIEQLKDRKERNKAVEALVAVGQPAVPFLVDALAGRDGRGAMEVLERIGAPAVNALVQVLRDKANNVRRRRDAALVLGRIGPEAKTAVPDLIETFKDKNEGKGIRWETAVALGHIGPDAKVAVSELIKALADRDEDAEVRDHAAEALGRIGPEAKIAVPHLITVYRDRNEDEGVRLAAGRALGDMGPVAEPAIPLLAEVFRDKNEDERFRSNAASSLGGIRLPAAMDILILALTADDEMMRADAARGLGRAGPNAKAAFPHLINALRDPSEDVRQAANDAFREIGPPAVDILIQALSDQDELIREGAASALGEALGRRRARRREVPLTGAEAAAAAEALESAQKAAIPELINVISVRRDNVRQAAIQSLRKIGPPAIDSLIKALKEVDQSVPTDFREALRRIGPDDVDPLGRPVRWGAAEALREIGSPAVEPLIQALKGPDEDVRSGAAWALGELGEKAEAAVGVLIEALGDRKNGYVREGAAWALGQIGRGAKAAIPQLVDALDEDSFDFDVDEYAADALGKIGLEPENTIPALVKTLDAFQYENRAAAVATLAKVVQMQAPDRPISEWIDVIGHLERAQDILENDRIIDRADPELREDIQSLHLSIQALNAIKNARMIGPFQGVLEMFKKSWVFGPAVYLISLLSLWLVILRVRPLWLLRINDALKPYTDYTLSAWLGAMKVPLSVVLLVHFFHYRPRVLDAWVQAHVDSVEGKFQNKTTVRERKVHISVPAVLDNDTVAELKGKHLRQVFANRRTCLLIWGEGGVGKTSLACQVARWAMSDDAAERPCEHRMLPVLIEQELDFEVPEEKTPFLEAIQGQLQDLIDEPEPIPEELLVRLLRLQRILVIVDHLSEMGESTRKEIHPELPDFPANALIVTSRIEETLGGVTKSTIKPLRIEGNRLSSFMEAYLTHRGKRELFSDPEFFDACSRLSAMVGTRDITVLLAKLYAEQMIAAKEGTAASELPDNIPDLMLSYLNELNHGVAEAKLDDRAVHRDAKAVAWECLRQTFRPVSARLEDTLAALGGENAQSRLYYLETRLRLIQIIPPSQDRIRFLLDPLAEYLAGLRLVEICGGSEPSWREFLYQADSMPGAPQAITAFLLAVRDCCRAKAEEAKIPDFVAQELETRAELGAGTLEQAR